SWNNCAQVIRRLLPEPPKHFDVRPSTRGPCQFSAKAGDQSLDSPYRRSHICWSIPYDLNYSMSMPARPSVRTITRHATATLSPLLRKRAGFGSTVSVWCWESMHRESATMQRVTYGLQSLQRDSWAFLERCQT